MSIDTVDMYKHALGLSARWVFVMKFFIIAYCCMMLPLWGFAVATFASQPQDTPSVAVVFGAEVRCNSADAFVNQDGRTIPNCRPSAALERRLQAALELYQDEIIQTIIVSGDNRTNFYSEPDGMRQYLIQNGVDSEDIIQDFAGRSTAETCWRTRHVFGAESVFVVTQPFHIWRATALCQSYELSVQPYPSSNTQFASTTISGAVREVLASWNALLDLFQNPGAVPADGTERQILGNYKL